ncbi:MAG: hypothetical protein ABJV04_00565 [Aliiglaciecola sp.]|uniref:hypothetical protein n=1 Tax=Aliiglaciecola sp. TaxID=1872441 RepID=UPI0032973D0E
MSSKYQGVYEYNAKVELLNFLELIWVLDSKRFSRSTLINILKVPNSIARAFSQGKSKNSHLCYKNISDVNPKIIEAIVSLVFRIEQARAIDKLLENPKFEGGFFRNPRSKNGYKNSNGIL